MKMADEEDKPPAPPVRLASHNRSVLVINSATHIVGWSHSIWFVVVNRNEAVAVIPLDLKPLPSVPESEKKKTLKVKSQPKKNNENKPNISYPTNFEHTVHVGFDAITGEFTVIYKTCL